MKRKLLIAIFGAVASLYPLHLLWPVTTNFNDDWYGPLWWIGYFGKYFAVHREFPMVVNTAEAVGTAGPLFYGTLFAPLAGFFSSFFGPNIGLRLILVPLAFVNWLVTRRLFKTQGAGDVAAFAFATLIAWASYPMTNLYNRGATYEFAAAALLQLSVCSFLIAYFRSSVEKPWRYWIAGGGALGLTVATHPITGLYGLITVLFVGMFFLVDAFHLGREQKRSVGLGLLVSVLCFLGLSAAWFAAYLPLGHELLISQAPQIISYLGIDQPEVRFALFPLDLRSLSGGSKIEVPYLEAQPNFALLFCALGILVLSSLGYLQKNQSKNAKRLGTVLLFGGGVYSLLALGLSISVEAYKYLPEKAQIIQFLYRMVTYQNIGFLLLTLGALMVASLVPRNREGAVGIAVVFAVCLTLAFANVVLKTRTGKVPRNKDSKFGYEFNPVFANAFLVHKDWTWRVYTTRGLLPLKESETGARVSFMPGIEAKYGDVEPVNVQLGSTQNVLTNVANFEWNKIFIDGVQALKSDLREHDGFQVVSLGPGAHELKTTFEPPVFWKIARCISLFSVFGWCSFLVVTQILRFKRRAPARGV